MACSKIVKTVARQTVVLGDCLSEAEARASRAGAERDEARRDRDGWKKEAVIRGNEINRLEGRL